MSDVLTKDKWIERVLGVSYNRPTPPNGAKKVQFAPVPKEIPPPDRSGAKLGSGSQPSGAPISPKPNLKPQEFTGAGGKKITITKTPDGKTMFTSPPPPVREITFSGGGAKGGALPGAVQALETSGILKDATKITGASVGSMTAALVAAGITAKEFTESANADATTARVVEGTGGTKKGLLWAAMKNKGSPLTGQGLEDVVRDVLDDTLRSRIFEYMQGATKNGGKPDQTVVDTAKKISANKDGATFMDMRVLSKVIPAIKEVVITGTYTNEKSENATGQLEKVQGGNDQGKLYIFDADSEPNLPVAKAVHASASFPGAFKPFEIKLSSGYTVTFIDGGVMNNTPTSSSVGNERNLDPMPPGRGMTFVFEEKPKQSLVDKILRKDKEDSTSDLLLKGMVKPEQGFGGKVADWFTGSNHIAAEYAKNRDMTDRPEEIVVVPLQVTLPPKKRRFLPDKGPEKIDMRDGTLNFGLSLDAKLALQDATKGATQAQIDREKQPKTREFASDSQMFVSIPMADLKALADSGYDGAQDAYDFRVHVAEMLDKLQDAIKQERAKAGGNLANVLTDKNATMALDDLNKLSAGNVDFQGYVGREMNKGPLDGLLDAIRKGGGKSDVLTATFAVSDALKAHTYADNILKNFVYPKMNTEPEDGAGIETLLTVEGLLRAAKAPEDVNEALTIAIDHFKTKSDRHIPKRGHKEFAAQLSRWMMPLTA